MGKKIAIIGASHFQNPLILKAKMLGYETHVFSWEEGAVGKEHADYFYPISIIEKEKILKYCQRIGICGITSIASDLAAITVNYVAQNMGLPGNDMECVLKTTNKYEMRMALKKAGIPVPAFVKATKSDCIQKTHSLSYPLIVKPTDRSGSRSITKVEAPEELEIAVNRAAQVSFEGKAIIEEVIVGEEFSMETLTVKGKHYMLAVTKKFTTGAPNYIEYGHMEPSFLSDEIIIKAREMIFKALDALGVTNSAGHGEFRITSSGDIRIIEIGARMGGDCIGSHLVQISTGIDYLKMVILTAVGEKIKLEPTVNSRIGVVRFFMGREDIWRWERYCKQNKKGTVIFTCMLNTNEHDVIDSGSRYGYCVMLFHQKEDALYFLEQL